MRLTNLARDSFVSMVMQDVPVVDYAEQAKAIYLKAWIEDCPAEVQKLWHDARTRSWLNTGYTTTCNQSFALPCPDRYGNLPVPERAKAEVTALNLKHQAQTQHLSTLRSNLHSVAYSCHTLKALKTALPEFEKYMPEEDAPLSRSVPALANVVSDFVKAGWPKTKAKEAETAAA